MAVNDCPHIPRVPPELVNETQLRVWCDWCKAWHYHGAGVPGTPEFPILGHRVEHCHRDDGPYSRFGYWLVPVGEG